MASMRLDVRPSAYHIRESGNLKKRFERNGFKMLVLSSAYDASFSNRNSGLRSVSFSGINPLIRSHRLGKGGIPQGTGATAESGGTKGGVDWIENFNKVWNWKSTVKCTCEKALEAFKEASLWLDDYPIVEKFAATFVYTTGAYLTLRFSSPWFFVFAVIVIFAMASRNILWDVLCVLLYVRISRPFSIGDTIKVESLQGVEGVVAEIGPTFTTLLIERFPLIIPHVVLFRQRQVIVNKGQAKCHSFVTKIAVRTDDSDTIPQMCEDINSMLRSNSNLFLEKEAPYCYLSNIGRSYAAEFTLGCNLKQMNMKVEQEILREIVRVVEQHGAEMVDGDFNRLY